MGPGVLTTEHSYPNGIAVRLLFFRILRFAGVPANKVFEQMAWVLPEELSGYDFLEADRALVERLARGEVV